jgi:hypothetical protein
MQNENLTGGPERHPLLPAGTVAAARPALDGAVPF